MTFKKRSYYLHRLVYWIGSDLDSPDDIPTPPEVEVRHLCQNKTCILSDHYILGTAKENYSDRPEETKAGEKHPSATITLELAQAIADSWKPAGHPEWKAQSKRALHFAVSRGIVNAIDARSSWPQVVHPNGKNHKMAAIRKNTSQININDVTIEEIKHRLLCNVESFRANDHVPGDCHITKVKKLSALGVMQYAHRWACIAKEKRLLNNGEIARHQCGQSLCINPDHLKAGTYLENANDKRIHDTYGGKLKEFQVKRILSSNKTIRALAQEYDVSPSNIALIRNGKTWKYLSGITNLPLPP